MQLAVIDVNRGTSKPSAAYVAFVRDRPYTDEEWSENDNNVRVYEANWLLGGSGYVLPAFEAASSATTTSGEAVWKELWDASAMLRKWTCIMKGGRTKNNGLLVCLISIFKNCAN